MVYRDRLELPPQVESPRAARAWIRTKVADTDAATTAALLVSELVSNSVLHARTDLAVTVEVSEGAVVVEVEDCNPAPVPVRLPGDAMPSGATGRGLHLVAELAASWGVRRVDGGKVVWFELPMSTSGGHA